MEDMRVEVDEWKGNRTDGGEGRRMREEESCEVQ
jgi:hypothetical protein